MTDRFTAYAIAPMGSADSWAEIADLLRYEGAGRHAQALQEAATDAPEGLVFPLAIRDGATGAVYVVESEHDLRPPEAHRASRAADLDPAA